MAVQWVNAAICPKEGVFDKSHDHQQGSGRRLVIEALYQLDPR
jgi:hypothetical protein